MEELLTTLSLSKNILVDSMTGIPSMRSLKRSAVMCYTQALADINSLQKLLASTVFYLFIYGMMGDLFKKMINPVWPLRVTLLAAWDAPTYEVVLTVTPIVSGHICEGGNCSSASQH